MTDARRMNQRAAMLLAALLSMMFLTALTLASLVTLDHLKYVILGAHGGPASAAIRAALTRVDWVGAGMIVVLGSALVLIAEMRRGFVALWSSDTGLVWLPVGAALLWCGHAILCNGLIVTGDAGTHVARVNHLAMALLGGDSLYWDNYFFGGSTLLQFTGPVFHWIAVAADLVVGDATRAIKYSTFAARITAALFMYVLIRRFGAGRAVASLTALFYGGSFFMTYMEIIRSSFPQLINFTAMPAMLYFQEDILRRPAVFGGGTVGLSLSAILFIGSHQPTALIFGILMAVYVFARMAATGWTVATVKALAGAPGLIALGSVFFLVPFALERGMTADNFSATSLVTFAWPSMATLRSFVVWGSAGTGPVYAASVGLPMLLCVAGGAYAVWANPRAVDGELRFSWWLVVGLALLTLVLRGAYVREATFTFFFLCVAAGLGLEMIARGMPNHGGLLATLFILMLLDAGPLAIQPWTRSDFVPIAEAGEYLGNRSLGTRVVEVERVDGKSYIADDPSLGPLDYGRLQILMGPHKQDATKAHNGFAALLKITQRDLQAGKHLEPTTRAMLAAVNVGWIVSTDAARMGLADDVADTVLDPVLGAVLRIPEATPYLVSGRLETVARPASFDLAPFWDFQFDHKSQDATAAMAAMGVIRTQMQPDPVSRQAAAILVPIHPSNLGWDAERKGSTPIARLLSYVVAPGTVELSVESDRNGFIRLAHPLALGEQVTQDGKSVAPLADVQSLIVLPMHEGRNNFIIAPMPSKLRRVCFWMTVMMLAGLSVTAMLLGLRRWLQIRRSAHNALRQRS